MTAPHSESPRGWVLYDDACGICRRMVKPWLGTLRRHGFEAAPLQEEWVAKRLGLSEPELLLDTRLLLNDGTHLQGADAYRYVWRRIWWAYPVYLLSVTPGIRRLFDRAYRAFADHRHQISGACNLPGDKA
jgi:predicted DCC family thiol-disulfide oxidoreductase YuxK